MTRAEALQLISTRIAEASADGAEILLTPNEILRQLGDVSLIGEASFLYVPFARKAAVSYSLIGPDLIIDRNSSATEVNRNQLLAQVASNVPRIEFDANGVKGHLVEPQGTNLENDSCGRVGSNVGGLTRTTGGLSPTNAGNEGITVTEQTGTGEPFFFRDVAIALGDVTYSIFVKFKDGIPSTRQIKIQIATAFNYQVTITQGGSKILETGTGSSTIIHLGDGWFRILVSGVATATTFRVIVRLNDNGNNNYIGTGIDIFDYYLRQVEQLPYATSPIFTNGAAGTRLAENPYFEDDLQQYINPFFGTIVIKAKTYGWRGGNEYLLSLNKNQGTVDFIGVCFVGDNSLRFRAFGGLNTVNTGPNDLSSEQEHTIVMKYEQDNFKAWVDGILVSEDNSVDFTGEWNRFQLGISTLSSLERDYKLVTLYKNLLSDEQCLQLSQLSSTSPTSGEGNYRTYNLRDGESQALSGDLWNYIRRIQVITNASATATITLGGNNIVIQPGEDFEFEPQAGQYYGVSNIASSGGTTQFIFWL